MRPFKSLILLAVIVLAALFWNRHPAPPAAPSLVQADGSGIHRDADGTLSQLPVEARDMLARIARGGPYSHSQDGAVFGNYEGLLPKQPRGYYHEYTVETPGAGNRGARRIIIGGTPPAVWYYTDDHYRSFRRLETPH